MNILGIETSCDETAAAVVQDGRQVLSNVVASQIDIHRQYGGVVPEVAARSHIEAILPVVQKALDDAELTWDQIDGIAVTAGPGLLGSLLIGTLTAKTLAEVKNKLLYAIDHVEAHAYAGFLVGQSPQFPFLALIVSGGHSQLVLFQDHGKHNVLGQTRDDAAGEAFDKVAKLLDLGFPGGPAIGQAALKGNDTAYKLPKASFGTDSQDFSFSGLKTAVLRLAQELCGLDHTAPSSQVAAKLTEQQKCDIAASFQKTIVDTLVDNALIAAAKFQPKSVVLAGGVAANKLLRAELARRLPDSQLIIPDFKLCTDNAAMIAALGYHHAQAGKAVSPAVLAADSSLAM